MAPVPAKRCGPGSASLVKILKYNICIPAVANAAYIFLANYVD
jgi:hypothetical protein